MNKLADILRLTELFYKKAMKALAAEPMTYTMPDDEANESNQFGGDLIDQSDKFVFNNKQLFAEFNKFMEAYQIIVDILDSSKLDLGAEDKENFSESMQELDTLYKRILDNPYLNMGENYEEDFDPGDFTSFVQSVVTDVENRMKDKSGGENIRISDMEAAQIATQLNQQAVDRNDKNITWTGDKVQQLLEAKKTWFKKIMFIKKVGKSHPEFDKFERYISGRHKMYQDMMNDPARKAAYFEKGRVRFNNWFKTIYEQKNTLEALLARTDDPKKKNEIAIELKRVNNKIELNKARRQRSTQNVKTKMESKSIEGALERLRVKLKTQQSEIAKKIKVKAAQDPYFNSFKDAVKSAKEQLDRDPSPVNQRLLDATIKSEAEALSKYLNEHQVVVQVREDLAMLYSFRDRVKALIESESTDDAPATIYHLINEGQQLITTFGKIYKPPVGAIIELVEMLRQQI
jgi:hypothetical protein